MEWQQNPEKRGMELKKKERIKKAIKLAVKYGSIDGSHHKDWVIDQMVRVLAGDKYNKIVEDACHGEDGPNTYYWECGIAP